MSDRFATGQKHWTVFEIDGVKTLPLFALKARTLEEIPAWSGGQAQFVHENHDYNNTFCDFSPESMRRIATDPAEAKRLVKAWNTHQSNFAYFIQFCDDPSRKKVEALHDHTALVSALCDARLGIDTTDLWAVFDHLLRKEHIYSLYRADNDRDAKYVNYANFLIQIHESCELTIMSTMRLLDRIVTQIDLKARMWAKLPPIHRDSPVNVEGKKIRLFYSYSHRDETLRNKLEAHLAVLKRKGVIENWHDRRIGAGDDWKGSIDAEIEAADIILLLVSSDFLNSDYCYDVEMRQALERHDRGSAKVIPIILKPCLWTDAPFGKLQALPTDGKAVTTWSNQDKAFTDIAKGLSEQIRQWFGKTGTT